MIASSKRIPEFDGLRGVAAIVVVVSHIVAAFMPVLCFGPEGGTVLSWPGFFAMSPFFVMVSGSFAVFVFFVLSGFVIAASADASRSGIAGNCVARVIRLGLPCSASILLAGIFSKFHLLYSEEVSAIVNHWWIKDYHDTYSTTQIVRELLGDYFVEGSSKLNGVLWTMQRELLGSVTIYLLFGFSKSKFLRILGCILITAFIAWQRFELPYYICFVAGAAFFIFRNELRMLPSWVGTIALVFGLALSGRPYLMPEPGTFYYKPYVLLGKYYSLMWPVGAFLVVFGVFISSPVMKVLGSNVGQFLGRISFGVYLIHFTLLHSLMAYLFISAGQIGLVVLSLFVILYVVLVIAFAFAFTLLVDEPATRLAGLVKGLVWTIPIERVHYAAPSKV